jgi:hypothetical protein
MSPDGYHTQTDPDDWRMHTPSPGSDFFESHLPNLL